MLTALEAREKSKAGKTLDKLEQEILNMARFGETFVYSNVSLDSSDVAFLTRLGYGVSWKAGCWQITW